MKPDYEWHEAKNEKNIRDHGIDFNDARLIFDDPFVLVQPNSITEGEVRLEAIGMLRGLLILLVIYTVINEDTPNETIRLISARRATRWERRDYEQRSCACGAISN